MDSTSITTSPAPVVAAARRGEVKGLKIGVIRELGGSTESAGGFQAGVRARFDEAIALLTAAGAEVVEVRYRASSTPSPPTTW